MDETHKVTALLTLSQEKILSNHVSKLTKTIDKATSVLERLRDPLQFFLISLSCCCIGGTLASLFTLRRVARWGNMMNGGNGGVGGKKKKDGKEGKVAKEGKDDKLTTSTSNSDSKCTSTSICQDTLIKGECNNPDCPCIKEGPDFEAAWLKQRVMSDKIGHERGYFKHGK